MVRIRRKRRKKKKKQQSACSYFGLQVLPAALLSLQ
jgi:hypothetical protein